MMNTSEDQVEATPGGDETEIIIEEGPTIEISSENTDNGKEVEMDTEPIYSLRSREVRRT
jgi:hypothetical protein